MNTKVKLVSSLTILSLILSFSGCQKESDLEDVIEEDTSGDTEASVSENYWPSIDISYAAGTYDGHLANYTEFKDFDNDGLVDIVKSSYDHGIILFRNTGSGSFFSEDDFQVIFDPAQVDLKALGHWGDSMDHTATFGLADYNDDGFLDAVIEGPFSGFINTLEPIIVFAKGNGESLKATQTVEPALSNHYQSKEGFRIIGSHYFSSIQKNQVVYYIPVDNHGYYAIRAFQQNSICEDGILHNGNGECYGDSKESGYHLMHYDSGGSSQEFDIAESEDETYFFYNGYTYSDSEEQRASWGDNHPHMNEFRWPHRLSIQTDIGEFETNIYSIVYFRNEQTYIYSDFSVAILKNFENVPATGTVGENEEIYISFDFEGNILGGTAMDYNVDGLDDLIISIKEGSNVKIVVYENMGDYNFAESDEIQSFPAPDHLDFVQLEQYDFNNDGRNDLYLQGLGAIIINQQS